MGVVSEFLGEGCGGIFLFFFFWGGGGGGDKLTKIPSLKRKKLLVLGMGWDGGRDFLFTKIPTSCFGWVVGRGGKCIVLNWKRTPIRNFFFFFFFL